MEPKIPMESPSNESISFDENEMEEVLDNIYIYIYIMKTL